MLRAVRLDVVEDGMEGRAAASDQLEGGGEGGDVADVVNYCVEAVHFPPDVCDGVDGAG